MRFPGLDNPTGNDWASAKTLRNAAFISLQMHRIIDPSCIDIGNMCIQPINPTEQYGEDDGDDGCEEAHTHALAGAEPKNYMSS